MTRYQIVYNKSGYPLTTWSNNPDQAHELAEKFRKVGYSVDVLGAHRQGRTQDQPLTPPHLPTFTPGTSRNRKEVFHGSMLDILRWAGSMPMLQRG